MEETGGRRRRLNKPYYMYENVYDSMGGQHIVVCVLLMYLLLMPALTIVPWEEQPAPRHMPTIYHTLNLYMTLLCLPVWENVYGDNYGAGACREEAS